MAKARKVVKRKTKLQRDAEKLQREVQALRERLHESVARERETALRGRHFDRLIEECLKTKEGMVAVARSAEMEGVLVGCWSEVEGTAVDGVLAGRIGSYRILRLLTSAEGCTGSRSGYFSDLLLLKSRHALKEVFAMKDGWRVRLLSLGYRALPGDRRLLEVRVYASPPDASGEP